MSSRLPPTPSDNLSHKGPGEQAHAETRRGTIKAANDPGKQGQQGNTKINTTHHGYQQDR
ncbi:hypothetical protein [Neorhizobium petrolearium]|uniref:Uncharacterized protein n=1 Tax=Neorhizobium petrolearium TaxID=515361 RepID=A0ABY8MB81_9HYPH|nr:hypothetical protein [Neorhizobium petrolearium]MCC2613466.1 hypothetical protein [Neorhizobium petrolearium]WGI71791.1 hypothetical protein QEO92_26945 [Neorhizobium petrolearium]